MIDDSVTTFKTERTQYHRLVQSQSIGIHKVNATDRIVGGTAAQANSSYVFSVGTGLCACTLIWPDYVCSMLVADEAMRGVMYNTHTLPVDPLGPCIFQLTHSSRHLARLIAQHRFNGSSLNRIFFYGVDLGRTKIDGTTSIMIAVDSEHPNPLYSTYTMTRSAVCLPQRLGHT